jgi:GH18 family chitinase
MKTFTRSIAAFVVLLFVAATVATPPVAADTLPRIVGNYGSWSIYARDYHVAEIPAGQLTHLNYAFLDISPDGNCILSDPWADVQKPYPGDGGGPIRGNFRQLQILKGQYPELRTLLAIGGWTLSGRFSDVALTAASRQQFAQSCVELMRQYAFDGLDVDWEFPVSGGLPTNTYRPEDRENFTLLLAALRAELDAKALVDGRPYLLTASLGAAPSHYANLELDQIHAHLDWLSLMAYDFHGPWSPITHFHAPLFAPADDPPFESDDLSGDAAARAYQAAGIPDTKIVLGLPFFGRGWKNVGSAQGGLFRPHGGVPPGTYEDGVFDYRDLRANYEFGYVRHWHEQAKAPWLYGPLSHVMIAYDDPASIAAKAAYVDAHGLGGLMFWELSMDDDDHTLVDAVASGLHANCPAAPPTGCDVPGRSAISVQNGSSAKLGWTFAKGATARTPGDFGNPMDATTYTVCLYDHGARIAQMKIPPGAGWLARSTGYRYAAPAGITKMLLKAGDAGKPKVQVKGKGSTLPVISTPLPEPLELTVALIHDAGPACWAATYTSARTNVAGKIRARTP